MIKILFICHGNICRSTMAEYVMKALVNKSGLSDTFFIDSAATSREEIGNPVHYGTRHKLEEVGIYCGNHKARQMQKHEYDEYDYIIGKRLIFRYDRKNPRLLFSSRSTLTVHI